MKLKEFLIQTAQEIRQIENTAKTHLGTEYSKEYDELMHKKAHILSEIYENAQKQDMQGIKNSKEILAKLKQFSQSADTALSLNSSWYMYALLYPDDYQEGTPNNLEKVIDAMQE